MQNHQFLLAQMREICPNVADDLQRFWNKPITNYAAYIGQNKQTISSQISSNARELLFQRVINHASNLNPAVDRQLLRQKLSENAVCQSALHSQLYIDNMNFNGMLLGLMSTLLNDNPFYFIFNSSLVTLLQSGKIGPAWVNCSNTSLKIVDLPNSRLKDYSLCCIKENLIKIEDYSKHDLDQDEVNGIKKIAANINPINPCNLSAAFAQLNTAMIKSMCGNRYVEPIIVDDSFFADLIIDHIQDDNGFIYQLLFNPSKRERLFNLFSLYKNSKFGNFLADGTDLFWGIGNKKIRSLKLGDNILSSKEADIAIPFHKDPIILSLQNGSILPNMFLCYLCLAILPNIQVQGGTRMIVYLPLFKKMILELLDTTKENERHLYFDLIRENNFTWGARVIESMQPPIKLLGSLELGREFEQLLDFYSTKTLNEATQDLSMFQNHQRWKIVLET